MSTEQNEKKVYRSRGNKMLGGVCAGLAEYFNVDPTLVRLGFVALCIFAFGSGLIAYIVALIIMPEAPEGYEPAAPQANAAQSAEGQTAGREGGTDTVEGDAKTESESNSDTPTMI